MNQRNLPVTLDEFDLAILRLLQQDCATPHRKLGEQVNLSTASVQRRIRKMEKDGVIAAQTVQINPKSVGLPLTIVVEVELQAETAGKIDKIKRSFQDAPEIQQCYYVTGEADFVLIVVVGDMSEYESLTQRLFFPNENIRKFRTFVSMDRTKVSMQLNI
ncbi:Lrp/AsnC family transcriptional regulator [Thalassococcus lentus]|uniref:Lrp/AsnC family transcriptional regulator n=1 Tax=Thalassococcus lentus TaxID=1210524 RepID=A0ABT4XMT8_9RHOB|nr:Lrp/AsnC family transcriptional regulator [Thalassococcus lentus]MDA7423193.1 Lrp/AsnC family transcriptional regulator [Thalassococcus lentus]